MDLDQITRENVDENAAEFEQFPALNKLKEGPGNLIKRVEDIKKLGAKAGKSLPTHLVREAEEEPPIADSRDEP